MKLNDAKARVYNQIMRFGGYWPPLSMMLRLLEETGELAKAINIEYGSKKSKNANDGKGIPSELSDVFYTILALANRYEVDFKEVGDNEISYLQSSLDIEQNDIDYLGVLSDLVIQEGILYALLKNNDEINDINKSSIHNIVNESIKIATLLKVDLSTEFSNKIGIDDTNKEKIKAYS